MKVNIGDIIEKDGEKHIITNIAIGAGVMIETMPVREYVEKCRMINIAGVWMTVSDFLDYEVERLISHQKDVGCL